MKAFSAGQEFHQSINEQVNLAMDKSVNYSISCAVKFQCETFLAKNQMQSEGKHGLPTKAKLGSSALED
jgi:hypothetical protein